MNVCYLDYPFPWTQNLAIRQEAKLGEGTDLSGRKRLPNKGQGEGRNFFGWWLVKDRITIWGSSRLNRPPKVYCDPHLAGHAFAQGVGVRGRLGEVS